MKTNDWRRDPRTKNWVKPCDKCGRLAVVSSAIKANKRDWWYLCSSCQGADAIKKTKYTGPLSDLL
jgi:transcription elongation factor Elf1